MIIIQSGCLRKTEDTNRDWRFYGGNASGDRYSDLTQINQSNVKQLKVAWTYDTGENNDTTKRGKLLEIQPVVVNGVLFGTTSDMKLFAVDGSSGKELWKFDPFEKGETKRTFHPVRGITYWEDGDDKRILYGVGSFLYGINATTGEKVKKFGNDGMVSLYEGLGDSSILGRDVSKLMVDLTSPGVIYEDLVIIGSRVSEGGNAAPGYIRAFNVRNGSLVWSFRTIPLPGEFGYDTWSPDSYKKIGGANNWAGLVIDEKRGIVFAGTGAPSGDFYGADRIGQNLFANCLLALDARTGKRIWHFQTVHHDLWDLDIPTPPNLLTVVHNGKKTDAVAQATKDGFVFLFNRENGEPLFPINEVPVKATYALPGEQPWPTQPQPEKPAPFAMQILTEDSLTQRTPDAYNYVLDRFKNSRYEGRYTNPSLEGSLVFFIGGGAEWGGNAVSPDGIFYVNSNNMLWWLKMHENPAYGENANLPPGEFLFNTHCASCHSISKENKAVKNDGIPGLYKVASRLNKQQITSIIESGRGRMPAFSFLNREEKENIIQFLANPEEAKKKHMESRDSSRRKETAANKNVYIPRYLNNGNTQFRDNEGYPAIKPPWGLLNAIDLNTGNYLWQVPLGEYPALVEQGLPATGTENHGGPIITAGGLLFIGATYDEKIRAFNRYTGEILWEYKLPAGGFATPITYMINGKQYIVIAAGGARYGLKPGGRFVAFALPDKPK